jgi:hypothetical protein
MFDPNSKSTKNLIEKYKALFELAIQQQKDSSLSTDQIKAIGNRVLNEIIEKATDNQNIPRSEHQTTVKQFQELIRAECPDMSFDSPLVFDDDGFHKKL